MTEAFDLVVLGGGSAGEYVASELAGERRVLMIEDRFVGGECPYIACIPSKVMLLAGEKGMSWPEAIRRRDDAVDHRDDSAKAQRAQARGVTLVRARGVVTAPGVVAAGGSAYTYTDLLISTGSEPSKPPVDGLAELDTWTSDDALSSDQLPERLLILGGGAVGCELAQVYRSFGVQVTVIEFADRLLSREPEFVGTAITEALRERGVDVRTGIGASRAEQDDKTYRLHLENGDVVDGDRLLVAAGKTPRTANLGLEKLGIDIEPGDPLPVDDQCRVIDHSSVWAAGDVTGIAPYTHTANYHARTIIAAMQGRNVHADHSAIPRAVYTDPAAFGVGLTPEQAKQRGITVETASFDVGETARAFVERKAGVTSVNGRLELYADRDRGVLVGAAAVGTYADVWGGELILAVRAQVPVHVLADVVHAFPTVGEAIEPPARKLAESLEKR
jgi:dihydrolipoamide dehydrogenase